MALIALVCVPLVAFAALSWWVLAHKRMGVNNWMGCAAVFLWLMVAGAKLYVDRSHPVDDIDRLLSSSAALSWGDPAVAPSSRSAVSGSVGNPGTVGSLVGRLEAKLAQNPDDAKGWALLAQSYSFIGDSRATERAVARAVELGFEERDLRNRVEQARRVGPQSNGG